MLYPDRMASPDTSTNAAQGSAQIFAVDTGSKVAPFRQLHDCVVDALSSGSLLPGARLPTVRGLAEQLGVAANTVAAAYRSLEEAGVVEGRGRSGTFVKLGDNPVEQ